MIEGVWTMINPQHDLGDDLQARDRSHTGPRHAGLRMVEETAATYIPRHARPTGQWPPSTVPQDYVPACTCRPRLRATSAQRAN